MSLTNVTIKGTPSDVIWGAANLIANARIVRGTRRQVVEKVALEDSDGIPTGSILIPGDFEYEIEIECQTNTALPNIGDSINIAGDANCIVNDVSENWQRKGIKSASIKAYRHCK